MPLHPVVGREVPLRIGDELAVRGVVDGLDADDAGLQRAVVLVGVADELKLRRGGADDQNALGAFEFTRYGLEEMMRVAMEVSDRDIVYLRELVKIEGSQLANRDHIPRYDAHTAWINGFWGDRVVPEVDSVFQKLESYGLVTRTAPPNNQNIMADIQNRYVLLPKGLRFVNLIKSRASS